jgi:hypothetical protein
MVIVGPPTELLLLPRCELVSVRSVKTSFHMVILIAVSVAISVYHQLQLLRCDAWHRQGNSGTYDPSQIARPPAGCDNLTQLNF